MKQSFQWEQETKKEWEARAASWDGKSIAMWDHGSRKDIVPFMEKHVETGAKVIDVGCGSGYGTYKLHRAGYHVEGIDISEKMLQLAKERCQKLKIPFTEANINKLPFPEQYSDGMMVINVLEWTQSPYKAMQELKRVLKQGGFLCVGILGPTAGPRNHGYRRLYGENAMINTMMPWEFIQLAKEMNFQLVDDFGVFKEETNGHNFSNLSKKLQQSLSFMWVFMLQKPI